MYTHITSTNATYSQMGNVPGFDLIHVASHTRVRAGPYFTSANIKKGPLSPFNKLVGWTGIEGDPLPPGINGSPNHTIYLLLYRSTHQHQALSIPHKHSLLLLINQYLRYRPSR